MLGNVFDVTSGGIDPQEQHFPLWPVLSDPTDRSASALLAGEGDAVHSFAAVGRSLVLWE